jgi:hypothetical protein
LHFFGGIKEEMSMKHAGIQEDAHLSLAGGRRLAGLAGVCRVSRCTLKLLPQLASNILRDFVRRSAQLSALGKRSVVRDIDVREAMRLYGLTLAGEYRVVKRTKTKVDEENGDQEEEAKKKKKKKQQKQQAPVET